MPFLGEDKQAQIHRPTVYLTPSPLQGPYIPKGSPRDRCPDPKAPVTSVMGIVAGTIVGQEVLVQLVLIIPSHIPLIKEH